MLAGFFLGRIVEDDLNDLALWDTLGRLADDRPSEVPSFGVERTTEEHIEACKVLHRGGPGEPHIGGKGVVVGRQGPATGQQCEALPGGGSKKPRK